MLRDAARGRCAASCRASMIQCGLAGLEPIRSGSNDVRPLTQRVEPRAENQEYINQ